MSKAFTREDDDAPEAPAMARPAFALPPGAANCMTADGWTRLQQELASLCAQRTSHLAEGTWTRSMEQRLVDLEFALSTAEVVSHDEPTELVRFGDVVRVRAEDRTESSYRIVGVDETDLDRGWVSRLSPIARALLGARRGERVTFRFPTGEMKLEIVSISNATDA